MTSNVIPYQLRPNKFIDRQMFLDLLSRIIYERGPENYIYVSMGGRHLADHWAIYRQLGIKALFSFDREDRTVRRQKANKPLDGIHCEQMDSSELPGKLDSIVQKFGNDKNVIVWLDFTDARSRRGQLQQTVELLKKLHCGDVFRVTLNANEGTLGTSEKWKDEGYASPGAFRLAKLQEQIDEFLPSDVTEIRDGQLPLVLARCVEIAVQRAQRERPGIGFKILLATTYRDGQRMITATCLARKEEQIDAPLPEGLGSWPFLSRDWAEVQAIQAPELSIKEKHRVDEHILKPPREMLAELTFLESEDESERTEAEKELESYRRFHRYYPTFHHIDV